MSFAREWNHFTAKRRGLGRNLTGRRTKIDLLPSTLYTLRCNLDHYIRRPSLAFVAVTSLDTFGSPQMRWRMYSSPKCAYGYSAWSFLTFTIIMLLLIAILPVLLIWKFEVRIHLLVTAVWLSVLPTIPSLMGLVVT